MAQLCVVSDEQVNSCFTKSTKQNLSHVEHNFQRLVAALFKKATPTTIRDAMTICNKLGLEYLWVDRICTLQNDKHAKAIQIDAIGDVYGNSEVTLVPLDGDIRSGFPGVSRERKYVTKVYNACGMHFIKLDDTYKEVIQRSKWARGWTFQEALLSSRLLLFSDQAVFLENVTYLKRERERVDIRWNDEDWRMFSSLSYRDKSRPTPRGIFITQKTSLGHSLEYYTATLASILRFHRAIFWQTTSGKYLPRAQQKDDIFPTWSWSSVQGSVEMIYRKDYSQEGSCNFAISSAAWAIPCINAEKLNTLRHNTKHLHGYWDTPNAISGLAAVRAWNAGCFTGELPSGIDVEGTWRQYKFLIKRNWPSLDFFCNDALSISKTPSLPQQSMEQFLSCVTYKGQHGRVLEYTQSIRCHVVLPHQTPDGFAASTLKIEDNEVIGWLSPQATDQERLYDLYRQNPNTCVDVLALALDEEELRDVSLKHDSYINGLGDVEEACWRDFAGNPLSLTEICYVEGRGSTRGFGMAPDTEEEDTSYGFTGYSRDRDRFLAFMVGLMVVETEGSTSTRLGIGRAFLKTWTKARPQFRTFSIA